MDEAEIKRIASYIEGLEEGCGDRDCREPATYRQLIKLHLTIERLAGAINQTKDEQLSSTLSVLRDKARRCKQCLAARLVVHS